MLGAGILESPLEQFLLKKKKSKEEGGKWHAVTNNVKSLDLGTNKNKEDAGNQMEREKSRQILVQGRQQQFPQAACFKSKTYSSKLL